MIKNTLQGIWNIFSQSTIPILILNNEGEIEKYNKAMYELTGYTYEEVPDIDSLMLKIIPEEVYRKKIINSIRKSFQRKINILRKECIITKKNGKKRNVEFTLYNVIGEEKSTNYKIVQGLDITEKILAEEIIRENRKRFQSIFEKSPDPICITTTEGKIYDVNRAWLNLFGYSREELKDITIKDTYVNSDDLKKLLMELLKNECVTNFEIKRRIKSGKELDCLVTSSLVRSNDGSTTSIINITRDITEPKRLEKQFIQSQKMEAIGTLAAGIAHDFNNILGSILLNTELALQDIPEDNPSRQLLIRVLKSGQRAGHLVEQILTFSRQSKQVCKPILIAPIVKEALNMLRASIPSTIEIITSITAENRAVLCDPTQIHQVLLNLCGNAAHAMRENGGILEVNLSEVEIHGDSPGKITELSPGSYIKLTVTDTGTGMEKAVMERVFDPFFTTKKSGEGTGMGLAVVHGIVKSCGGAITVQSEPGKGSAFEVFFPSVDFQIHRESITPESIIGGNEQILFVDDENEINIVNTILLQKLGYTVTVTPDSIEALEIFRLHPDRFDLVITDLTMPGMNGMKLSREIRNIRPDIPIILCTGFSDPAISEVAREAGIKEVLKKPLSRQQMAESIKRVLNKGSNQ